MVKTTQTLFCFSMLVAMASCSTTSKSAIDASSKEHKSVDGFASESVREAYLRLKKQDYNEQDQKKEVEESVKIAKTK